MNPTGTFKGTRLAQLGWTGVALLLGGCPEGGGQDDMAIPDLAMPAADMAARDMAGPPPDLAPMRLVTVIPNRPQRDLDVLFMIDNSPSMSPKQQALTQAFPSFIQKIDASGANYQIGVVTSDVGSWVAPGRPWSVTLGTCNTFEGDDGLLQRVACNTRSGLTQTAVAACQALCPDPKFVPEGNAGFIRKVNGVTNVPKYIDPMTGKDIGPQKAFQCLALVGDNGCGIEGQLEGAKRALDGHLAANANFLRPGSVLSVIMITDEDDCSVSLAGRPENDPTTRNCAAGDANAGSDCFNPDYRCLARSTTCDQPLNTPGLKTNCRERAVSYLEPVATYASFFSSLRSASKLLVSGIYALPALPTGKLSVTYERNGSNSFELNRGTGAEAACVSAADPSVIGRPQHRLSKFTRSFRDGIEINICDTSSYAAALDRVADAIKTRLSLQCIPAVPLLVSDGGRMVPDCQVGDVLERTPNAPPAQTFPACSAACCGALSSSAISSVEDPAVRAACAAEVSAACFCASAATGAAAANNVCAGGVIAAVLRKAGPDSAPPETVASFACNVR